MTYKINEIFYSVQGEGVRVGTVNVFVRFSECNLRCIWCDTNFASFVEMAAEEIVNRCEELDVGKHRAVVVTGGEPSLQWDEPLACLFRERGWFVAMETNGMHRLKANVDFLTVSPKTAEHSLLVHKSQCREAADELKYVLDVGQPIPTATIPAEHYLVSPLFRDGWTLDPATVEHCMNLCKENPPWRLSLQLHKFLQIR